MKMAKPDEKDIEAGGKLMALLNEIDSGYYPFGKDDDDAPMFFDEDDRKHLRQFYDEVKSILDSAPGFQGRVIGGMCFVIMYDKNEIVDPDSDTIDLHPKLKRALEAAPAAPQVPTAAEVRAAALEEAAQAADEIEEGYMKQQGGKWPELRDDAETGARDCAAAIRALATAPSVKVKGEQGEMGGDDLRVVAGFLMGESELEGVNFGERHPTKAGAFWWRLNLRAALHKARGG